MLTMTLTSSDFSLSSLNIMQFNFIYFTLHALLLFFFFLLFSSYFLYSSTFFLYCFFLIFFFSPSSSSFFLFYFIISFCILLALFYILLLFWFLLRENPIFKCQFCSLLHHKKIVLNCINFGFPFHIILTTIIQSF